MSHARAAPRLSNPSPSSEAASRAQQIADDYKLAQIYHQQYVNAQAEIQRQATKKKANRCKHLAKKIAKTLSSTTSRRTTPELTRRRSASSGINPWALGDLAPPHPPAVVRGAIGELIPWLSLFLPQNCRLPPPCPIVS